MVNTTEMFSDYPDVLNINQLKTALGCGKNAVYELINRGEIKSFKIGKIHKIPKAYLIEYVLKSN